MEKTVRQTYETIYTEYLQWFRELAIGGVDPKGGDEIIRYRTFSEDVYEDKHIILNRVYFMVPLSPMQTKSGRLESFAFSELNLMVKQPRSDGDEIMDFRTIEYRRESH